MANEFARNQQDTLVNPAAFVLPAAASTSTQSTSIDFGIDTFKNESIELELSVPALNTTIVPDTRTVTYIIEASATDFGTVTQTLMSEVATGAGAAGVAAFLKRVRLPSNCSRYVRFRVLFGASTTTGAAVSATGSVRF